MSSIDMINLMMLIGLAILIELAVIVFSVFLGAFIALKGFKIGQGSGESMLGGVPKGAVFTVGSPEEADGMVPEEDERNVLKRTTDFLSFLDGRGGKNR